MGGPVKKAFIELAGRALLLRSLDAFAGLPWLIERVAVLPADILLAETGQSRRSVPASVAHKSPVMAELARLGVGLAVAGGARRQDSVRHGLEALSPACKLALVHDAARPFVTKEEIEKVAASAAAHGAAILACPVRDTIKRVNTSGIITGTVERADLMAAQTPQAFDRERLLAAHHAFVGQDVTDDAALLELAGHPVHVAAGSPSNLKLTTPEDMALAEWLLSRRAGGA